MYSIETLGPWGLEHYAIAAHQLGLWNGACLSMDVQPDRGLPTASLQYMVKLDGHRQRLAIPTEPDSYLG